MIVVDTSALMAVLLNEASAEGCMTALAGETLVISAATVAEALIVAGRRGLRSEMEQLIDGLGFEVSIVTPAAARRVVDAYEKWGKGAHSAALNFGDCFAYELARERGSPLLFVGDDFTRTDVLSALKRL